LARETATAIISRWARESGLRASLGPALSRLALAEILRSGARRSPVAWSHLEQALADSSDADRGEALLILGLLAALPPADPDLEAPPVASTAGYPAAEPDDDPVPVEPAPDTTLAAFRGALDAASDRGPRARASDDEVLHDGWRAAALLLLRVCPTLGLLALERAGEALPEAEVAADPELARARDHAVRSETENQVLESLRPIQR